MGLFGRPVPRGSWAAWAGEPQALSPVAATTCRVSMAAWKARRGSAKVGLNGTFPAKFQHLYTTLTWRFLGWSGARETLSVVSLPPSSFGFHPSLERQSRCEPRAMEPAVCWMFRYPYPSRSGGRGPPVPSARSICAMSAALDRGLKPGVDGCLSTRTTYETDFFPDAPIPVRQRFFPPGSLDITPPSPMDSLEARRQSCLINYGVDSLSRLSRYDRVPGGEPTNYVTS